MKRWHKQALAICLFVPAIVGALVPSYLHLADWYEAWMPDEWKHLSYVAALVTEAPVIACGISVILMPPSFRKRWPVYALLVYSVAVSIYVNARWAWSHAPPPANDVAWWGKALDVALGSAVLPLFALFCELALDVVLRFVESDPERKTATRKAGRKTERKQAKAAAKADPQATMGGQLAAKWRDVVERHGPGKTLSELATLEGVSRQALGQWRKAATTDGHAPLRET